MKNLASDIVSLPNTLLLHPNEYSAYSLLERIGYFTNHASVTTEILYNALEEHSESIENWLRWSADKRTDSGWYFDRKSNGKYVVGYFPAGKESVMEFTDPLSAAADFIKREIEDIRRT